MLRSSLPDRDMPVNAAFCAFETFEATSLNRRLTQTKKGAQWNGGRVPGPAPEIRSADTG
jgi:hypothetical protein